MDYPQVNAHLERYDVDRWIYCRPLDFVDWLGVFRVLANVRNPRGLTDASPIVQRMGASNCRASWLSLEELIEFNWNFKLFFGCFYKEKTVPKLLSLAKYGTYRVAFWFE